MHSFSGNAVLFTKIIVHLTCGAVGRVFQPLYLLEPLDISRFQCLWLLVCISKIVRSLALSMLIMTLVSLLIMGFAHRSTGPSICKEFLMCSGHQPFAEYVYCKCILVFCLHSLQTVLRNKNRVHTFHPFILNVSFFRCVSLHNLS
jgi:hypothetical protein